MGTLNIVLGIILIIAALFLIIAVLFQTDKSDGLSGVIGGGSDNYLGNSNGKTSDKILSRLTAVVAVFFALVVLFIYVIQDNSHSDTDGIVSATGSVTTAVAESTDDSSASDSTAADTTDITSDIVAEDSDVADTTADAE